MTVVKIVSKAKDKYEATVNKLERLMKLRGEEHWVGVSGTNVVKQASNLEILTLKPEYGYKESDVSEVIL